MKRMARIVGAMAFLLMSANQGLSDVRISTEERSYPVAGRTGPELYASMLKKAPKRTIFTQDFAQYKFKFTLKHRFVIYQGSCSVKDGAAVVQVTATYPRAVDKLSPEARQAWTRLVADMHRQEAARIRIARQHMADLIDAIEELKTENDPTCTKIRRPLNKLWRKANADNEIRQKRFGAEGGASGAKSLNELRFAQ